MKRWAIFLSILFGIYRNVAMHADDAIEHRIEYFLSQMTIKEKIDYIGGHNSFYIRAIPRLKIPEIRIADGPVGVRNYGPSTTYPAGINIASS